MRDCATEPTIYYRTIVVADPDRAYFPYPRFWRGDYRSSEPIILDRLAGFFPRLQKSNGTSVGKPDVKPNVCFAPAPSTRFPCRNHKTEAIFLTR